MVRINERPKKVRYEKVFEYPGLLGYDVIDFQIMETKDYWRLFINNQTALEGVTM